MVNLQIYKQWKIVGKDGKIRWSKRKKAHSFVVGFGQVLELLFGHSYNAASRTVVIKDTSAASVNFALSSSFYAQHLFSCETPAGTTTFGLLVGTGTTAPAVADYAMQTLIAHGVGANQLSYSAGTVQSTRTESTATKLLIQRSFSNSSGGTITVKESGLVASLWATSQKNVLVIHEAENQAIANGESATLYYDFVLSI